MSTQRVMALLAILEQTAQTAQRIAELLEEEDLTDEQRTAVRERVAAANERWEEAGHAV